MRAKQVLPANDFVSIWTSWHGMWAATPENLGTDIGQTFKCSVVLEPELSVPKRIEQAEELLLRLADEAFDAFTNGNTELEQALDARAGILRAQLSKWQKTAGISIEVE